MDISLKPKIIDFVNEYEEKKQKINAALIEFEEAGEALRTAATISGTFGDTSLDTGKIYIETLKKSLNISAWRHSYKFLGIEKIASAKDKKEFSQSMAAPPEFTFNNVLATFRYYLECPQDNILRGLAEVFQDLDPAFKSHEKMKIGVKGLPKRVIISGLSSFWGYGKEKIEDIINAIALYEGKPPLVHSEVDALLKDENALLKKHIIQNYRGEEKEYPARGVRLKRYKNGNGHLYFEPETLKSVNKALAAFYGDVLADCGEDRKPNEPQKSTDIAKDLQYYPTPQAVVNRVLSDILIKEGQSILEPSCGCGRFLDALKDKNINALGVEVSLERANECKQKGHNVLIGNFLEIEPFKQFDHVIMNPPFYGKHYAKHVRHALKFLKEGGTLTAILPITARYDHGLLDDLKGRWFDLPFASFKESGTNINTCTLTIRK